MKSASRHMLIAALSEFSRCKVTVGGESMKPFIRSGDVATIVTLSTRPCLGQVAVFFNDDQLIMHRITRRERLPDGSWSLTVQGDSSPGSGGVVASSRIVGVVHCVKRNRRKHSLWLSSPLRILAIPVGFVIRFWVGWKRGVRRVG